MDEAYDRSFSYDWWNRYMKKSLGNLKLQMPEKAFSDFTIHKHAIRKIGKSFFLFIPFEGDGNVPEKWFDTIESTYEYPYGIFITDLPNAGVKIRSKSNGIRSYSGILRILNAGILIDEGSIEPIFGQIMKIFTSENETAYNNVIINFPPGWVELNVAREKIIGLSNINVCREKLLQGIAKYTLKALKLFTENKQTISLVNIQEIVNFITVICSDLNDDVSGKGKKLLAKLRKEKFLLRLFMTKDSLCLKMCKDNNEDMDMKVWLCENRACLPMESVVQPAFITERFFRDFEMQTGKKGIESIEEMNRNMSEQFSIPENMSENAGHDISILLFAAYILYFPESRIPQFAVKAAHARLNVERQLQKKYTVTEVVEEKAYEIITFQEIKKFFDQLGVYR